MQRVRGHFSTLLDCIAGCLMSGHCRRDMRRNPRHAHCEPVEILTPWGKWRGDLHELSRTGAKLRVIEGLLPARSEEVTIRCCDSRNLQGQVVWVRDAFVGVEFLYELSSVEAYTWVEARGSDWLLRTARLRGSR